MLYKLALVVLLPAMLLNGLWVVCPPQDGADSPESAKESADCIRICAALEASLGTICLLFPGHANALITVIDYGAVTLLPHATLKQPVDTHHQFQPMADSSYGDPYLSPSAPPPRLG
jgi:hypothetical protein